MWIQIKNMRLMGIIGVYEQERKEKQELIINIELEIDASEAVLTDNIEDTLDYDKLCTKIQDLVEHSQFYLVEKLAHEILKSIMVEKRIVRAKVEVDKPKALNSAESISVSCSAKQEEI